jgi:hypothetical protein
VFTGGADGVGPVTNLIAGKNGALYGTTNAGCHFNMGTVFELRPPAIVGPWNKRVVHSFAGGSDGTDPQTGFVADQNDVALWND